MGKYIYTALAFCWSFSLSFCFFGLQIWSWAAGHGYLGSFLFACWIFSFFLSVGFAFVLVGIVECALRVFENLFSFLVIHTKLGFGFVSYVPPLDAR
jgi:hypothetical protein